VSADSRTSTADYTVFISHKRTDTDVALSLKKLLADHTTKVDYFVSEEIDTGEKWRETIIKLLHQSRFLVLVFTDPHENWNWCLYETGFFDALTEVADKAHIRRIFCLHHPDIEPPNPIADLQTVPAKPEKVIAWLTSLFVQTQQPETKYQRETEIPQLAYEICGYFKKREPLYSAKSVHIEVDSQFLGSSPDDLPESSTIHGDAGLMTELFGSHTVSLDWASVRKRFDSFPNSSAVNLNAMKELSRSVHSIVKNNRVFPLQSQIFVGQGPKRYRPVISSVTELPNGRISCEILLIDEVGGPLQNVDKHLGALLTAIRMALRIRWEIIRPFVLDSNVRLQASISAKNLRIDLQTCFNNIFIEAEFRGNFSERDVRSAFDLEGDKDKIEQMIHEWPELYAKIWRDLGFNDIKETFSDVSVEEFAEEEIASLEAGMGQLEEMNREFLEIAVARAKVLVEVELASRLYPPHIRTSRTSSERGTMRQTNFRSGSRTAVRRTRKRHSAAELAQAAAVTVQKSAAN
jgi:hypothetical protein